MRPLRLACRTP